MGWVGGAIIFDLPLPPLRIFSFSPPPIILPLFSRAQARSLALALITQSPSESIDDSTSGRRLILPPRYAWFDKFAIIEAAAGDKVDGKGSLYIPPTYVGDPRGGSKKMLKQNGSDSSFKLYE